MVNKRLKQKAFFAERRKAIAEEKLLYLGPLQNMSVKSKGPLTTSDKSNLLRIFDAQMFKRSKVSAYVLPISLPHLCPAHNV